MKLQRTGFNSLGCLVFYLFFFVFSQGGFVCDVVLKVTTAGSIVTYISSGLHKQLAPPIFITTLFGLCSASFSLKQLYRLATP
jgi:hypothetical protein